ncbi:MAG: hypothetical protein WKF89_12645 [Chitinophagaceae bacterium]
MKKLPTLIFLFSLICSTVFAQQSNSLVALKFAPAGLAAGKITLGGEYNYKHRNSITLLVGLPFDKTQKISFNGRNSDVASKAFSIMAGYRHYLGRKTMNGFYLEPYLKYLKHEVNGPLNTDLQGQQVVFDTQTSYEGMGIGAQLGFQVLLAKFIVFDLFLIGPEANSAKFKSLSTDNTNNLRWDYADAQEAEQQIREVLKDIPMVGSKIEVKVNTEKKNVATSFSGFAPGFRIGASFGIRF